MAAKKKRSSKKSNSESPITNRLRWLKVNIDIKITGRSIFVVLMFLGCYFPNPFVLNLSQAISKYSSSRQIPMNEKPSSTQTNKEYRFD